MSAVTPRIAPGDRDSVGLFTSVISELSGRVTGTEPQKLFLTLGRHRKLFRGWLRFAGRLMPGGTLARRETELVILRVATLRQCAYELHHHRVLGELAGLTGADMERVTEGPTAGGWPARERAIIRAVDQLVDDRDLDDETWTALRSHLSENEAMELVLLVGHYEMLATAIGTLRIQPDEARPSGRFGAVARAVARRR